MNPRALKLFFMLGLAGTGPSLSPGGVRAFNTEMDGCAHVKNQTTDSPETVVLLHGLGLGAWSMKRIEWALERDGYHVVNVSYPSRSTPLDQLARDWFPAMLRENDCAAASRIHFVTHSMGGILLRGYLSDSSRAPLNLGRVVMIAPPNAGSAIVDHLGEWWLFRLFTSVNGPRLGTGDASFPNQVGPWNPATELGIIAGDFTLNPVFTSWHGGPNDGKVSVASSKLEGMRDHIVLHHSHTWLQYRSDVIDRVRAFVKNGKF